MGRGLSGARPRENPAGAILIPTLLAKLLRAMRRAPLRKDARICHLARPFLRTAGHVFAGGNPAKTTTSKPREQQANEEFPIRRPVYGSCPERDGCALPPAGRACGNRRAARRGYGSRRRGCGLRTA